MDPKRPTIISLLFLCISHCDCKTTSRPTNETASNDTRGSTEMPSTDFPGWALAVICVAIVCVLYILWFIWRYWDSWCSCMYCNRVVEDSVVLPLPQEGPGCIECNDGGRLNRYSSSGDILARERSLINILEVVPTKTVSKLYDHDLEQQQDYGDDYEAGYAKAALSIEHQSASPMDQVPADFEFESLISQAKEWQEKLIREGGTWRDVCYTATKFIAGLFDEHGGMLRMDRMGIRLLVPPGAIEGSVELIYIYIVTEQKNMPVIERGQVRAAPTVFCGPHGMEFLERVVLSYEHCANISDDGTKLLPVFTSSRPNEEMHFKNMEEEVDVLVMQRNGRCSIMISHFTGFSSIATSASPGRPLEIFMNLVVYSSSQQSSTRMILRLYYIHKTADALQMVVCEEESLNGIKLTPLTSWLFKTNIEATSILELDTGRDWENKDPKITVAAEMLRENNYITKSYKLSKTPSSNDINLSASIHVSQPGQSEQYNETLQILSQTNGELPYVSRRTSVLLKQPLRQTLKNLLEPEGLADWRMFAHKLDLDDVIPKLENDTRRRCATYELLNIWESTRSGDDAADWASLEGIFAEIGRKDVVTELLIAKSATASS